MSALLEECPYVYVISNSQKSIYCHFCFKRSDKLMRCSKCRFAHYCQPECQRQSWSDHKLECERLYTVMPKIPTDTARLMARIIFKENEKDKASKQLNNCRTFDDLISHSREVSEDPLRMDHFVQVCLVLAEYLGNTNLPSSNQLLEIFGKICINSFSILNDDMMPIGVGIYLQLSKLDHSCHPTATVVFSGRKAILNSLEPGVSSFDPTNISISYIELLATTQERQSQLKSQYYFICSCSVCSDIKRNSYLTSFRCSKSNCDGIAIVSEFQDSLICQQCGKSNENFDEYSRIMQHFRWELEKFEKLQKEKDFETLYAEATSLLNRDKNYLSDFNVYRIRLLDRLFDSCLELEKFDEAMKYLKGTIDCYKAFYPKFHPSLGLQLMRLGKLQLYFQDLHNALLNLQQAEKIILVIFGKDHSVYKSLEDLIIQCQEEMRVDLNRLQISEIYT